MPETQEYNALILVHKTDERTRTQVVKIEVRSESIVGLVAKCKKHLDIAVDN